MAAKTLEQLKEEATQLGITLTGEEKAAEISSLIKAKQDEEDGPEKTPEELQAESDAALAALKKQQQDKKNNPSPTATQAPQNERMYTAAEVKAMLQQVAKQAGSDDVEVEEDKPKPKLVSLPRFQNKFVLAFKNMNTDEYFPDLEIFAYDIFDDKTRQNIPWVTLMFDDGSELAVPLNTILKRANNIACELVKVNETDVSYDFGKVAKATVDGYERKETEELVKTKVTQKKYTYTLRLPGTGKEVTVSADVINWSPVNLK